MEETTTNPKALLTVKILHTIAWVFFVFCIAAIPIMTWHGQFVYATWFAVIVLLEVIVLVLNHWSCPLTPVAARFTQDRRANFDIFLPEWLARHNKLIFGSLYFAGVVYLVFRWITNQS